MPYANSVEEGKGICVLCVCVEGEGGRECVCVRRRGVCVSRDKGEGA